MIRTLLTSTALSILLTAGVAAQDAPANTMAPASTETPASGTDAGATGAGATGTDATTSTTTDTSGASGTSAAGATGTDAASGVTPVESGAAEDTEIDEPWDMSAGYVAVDSDNLGSQLIGQAVFSSAGDDAENIGNINDIVFSEDGQIQAVVIGVGGFLGIGEKSVAVPFEMLEFTLASDNTERWVLPTTADALNAAPEFVWEEDEPADANADGAMAPADGGAMAPADGGAMAPADGAATTTTN